MSFALTVQPLTASAFADFGDVVERAGAEHYPINQGFAERFNNLANIDVTREGGTCNVGIVVANPRPAPIALKLMERHPLGSQIFYPLQDQPWLVVVCHDPHEPTSYFVFEATGQQGINYKRNAWHHPLLVHHSESRFLVVDRQGPGNNLEEVWLEKALYL